MARLTRAAARRRRGARRRATRSTRRRSTAASARSSPGASAIARRRARRDARRCSSARSRCSASCRSSSSRRRRASSCWSTCACRKAARSRRSMRAGEEARGGARQAMPGIESYVTYVGSGAPRFYLPLDQQLAQANFAQFVRHREEHRRTASSVRARLLALFDDDFPELRGRVSRLENGPPVGFPVQFRVSGEDIATVRAHRRRGRRRSCARTRDTSQRAVRLGRAVEGRSASTIDQNKARVLGVSSQELADVPQQLAVGLLGHVLPRARQADRGAAARRGGRARAHELPARTSRSRRATASAVPITQIADIEYGLEEGIVWRRNRLPTITVRSDVRGDAQGPDVAKRIEPQLDRDPRGAAARLPHRDRRRDRGLGAGPEVDRRRHAAARDHRRADAADDPAAELRAHADGRADRAARPDRRRARAARCSASRSASSRCSARSRSPASSCATR